MDSITIGPDIAMPAGKTRDGNNLHINCGRLRKPVCRICTIVRFCLSGQTKGPWIQTLSTNCTAVYNVASNQSAELTDEYKNP